MTNILTTVSACSAGAGIALTAFRGGDAGVLCLVFSGAVLIMALIVHFNPVK